VSRCAPPTGARDRVFTVLDLHYYATDPFLSLSGVFASLSIAIFVSFFTITSFIMDPDLTIERYVRTSVTIRYHTHMLTCSHTPNPRYFLSPMTGIMATFTIPCLLNVSTMWLDVALSSMKGGSDSKGCFGTLCACCMPPENMTSATRKKFKAKVQVSLNMGCTS
jgi:hypothetical protein